MLTIVDKTIINQFFLKNIAAPVPPALVTASGAIIHTGHTIYKIDLFYKFIKKK